MSVEKMKMVNIIGTMDLLENVAKQVVLFNGLHPVNAMNEIDTTDFTISATEDNLEKIVDLNYVKPYVHERDYTPIETHIKRILEIVNFKESFPVQEKELILNYEELLDKIARIDGKFQEIYKRLLDKKEAQEKVKLFLNNISYFKDIDVPLQKIKNLSNFYVEVYKLTLESSHKLKINYENIPSMVKKVYKAKDYRVVIIITPNMLKNESDRILSSLNLETVEMPWQYEGTPLQIQEKLRQEFNELQREILELEAQMRKIYEENKQEINILNVSLRLQLKTSELKDYAACTNEFFYLCGWVSEEKIKNLNKKLSNFGNKIIILSKEANEIKNKTTVPPTKLNNNSIVRPFEVMVNMYGTPSYDEADPTLFLGISYMLIFGAMFGDVGQGLVFLIAGLFLKYRMRRVNLGGILARLGISSAIFGFLYGSVFGFEDVIPAAFIRPMENIQNVLIMAVIFGCMLLIVGFIFSLVNNFKRKDVENGVFGKDGVNGLLFYMLLLYFAYSKILGINTFRTSAWMVLFIAMLMMMVFKEPLANLVTGKRPFYSESKSDYFIEGGFGVLETLLGMFSNTISFIRVGAFALNHVGLFIAFSSLANMMNSEAGSVFMYVLGNIIIIGLEGLIVFIQGLRLEYYELFSKYYEGAGTEFQPIKLNNSKSLISENS
ncbi:V/A-type H+-transporting ATPase subunit I [Clostridium pascui]|uniref:V-type ATPase 116kDa subunit family protein n=1 Tax=Clostridium pascui TaxID=46609 RepID=UPI001956EB4E|nr:V/A-type H+-transporting ATPase subunit I [Clostridium pascui]